MNKRPGPTGRREESTGASPVQLVRISRGGKGKNESDLLAREEPLEIRVRGRGIAVTMRTPGNDDELAAGFLRSEGIIRDRKQITAMGPCLSSDSPENTLNVFLAPAVRVDLKRLTRHVFASSSCGVCGKGSIDAVHQHFPPIEATLRIAARTLQRLPQMMRAQQATFNRTGGLHAAGIFDSRGELMVLREDIGRHNAVDKVIGWGLLQGRLPYDSHVLLVSGRASFEILQKALAARVAVVCAVSAPSSLAVEFARESNQTLIGFLREEGMNIYAGQERISAT